MGLNDKYAGLRGYTMEFISKDSALLKSATVIQAIEQIAQTETDKKTKGTALQLLAITKETKYKPLYEKYLHDSSYSVAGSALYGLTLLDTANALKLVKQMAPEAGGAMNQIIIYTIMQYGKDEDADLMWSAFDDIPLSQEKVFALFSYLSFLNKVQDPTVLKSGVDKVVAYGKTVSGENGTYFQGAIKNALENIAKARGGEIATYIDNALK